ncbi:hypothetical protein G9A89_011223 [Geosiphon pyriformis]|nr:hypothetical protein G9A89_011223 [Geosiphon pyriformis]
MFLRLWFSGSDVSVDKQLLKFVKLELLVAKLMRNVSFNQVLRAVCLINTWTAIDKREAVNVHDMIENGVCSSVYNTSID